VIALPNKIIEQRLQEAVGVVFPDADLSSVRVQICPDPRFGDYQSNALMSLAKARKLNPRQVATDVASRLDLTDLCSKVDVAGAGFLNFTIRSEVLASHLNSAIAGDHLFFSPALQAKTVVIDFSSPNVAKPMHVGHIRSTILGDSLARTLRLLGHTVITDNHLGDWGTQFGMLLVGWKTLLDSQALQKDPMAEMERIYKAISSQCDPDKPGFNEATLAAARAELVKLQNGDAANLAIWNEMIRLSQDQFQNIYGRLAIRFDYTLGESFYNPALPGVVSDLMSLQLAQDTRGAKGIFSDGSLPPKEDPFLVHKDGEWVANPFLIQKQDGGFNYATTDLATLEHRWKTWQADEVIYVTDGRQQLHFRQLFASFQRWRPEIKMRLAHVWFGSILGEDGKPFKTRSGETVRLSELLDEAEERAFKVVSEKNPEKAEAERREIARIVGLGAIKYADLSPNRQSDYVFSWEKMLALHGNTAPYLQYAYARSRSILRKADGPQTNPAVSESIKVSLVEPEELNLARHMLNFGSVLEAVLEDYRPNYLCTYLYELAQKFTAFFEKCPVLKAEERIRGSRLILCDLTGRVLKRGLEALGIETLEQM
jgi:arginyl-tRNA synthetase